MEVSYQADLDTTIKLLKSWLTKQSSPEAMKWLDDKIKKISESKTPSAIYYMTFSSIPHYFGTDMLELSDADLKKAESVRKFWRPTNWSIAQAARAYFILTCSQEQLEAFDDTINKLLSAADIQELIAIYQTLPLFPYPEEFLLAGTNGIRSNMQSVFDSIALNNPYPQDYFTELAWNQLVLKTLFVESDLSKVVGLKRRANPTLAKALINTARERFAAGRPIKPELWCVVGFSTTKETLPLLQQLLEDKSPVLQEGAFIALDNSQLPEAKDILKKHPEKLNTLKETLQKVRDFAKSLV